MTVASCDTASTHRLIYHDVLDVTPKAGGQRETYECRHADDASVNAGDEQFGGFAMDDRVDAVLIKSGGLRELADEHR